MSVPVPKLALKRITPNHPARLDAPAASSGLDACPHCGRPSIVRSAPRCSFCGEALQAGAMSWSAVERENAARQAREQAAPEIVPPDIGLDAEARTKAYAKLRKLFLRSGDRVELIELFVRGLASDFPPEHADSSRTCSCGRQGEFVLSVNWNGRVDAGVRFDGWSVALLFAGLVSYKRQWMDFQVTTSHAACSACVRPKGWFDRYERFFGKVPRLLRVGRVERQLYTSPANASTTRGADLRYELVITAAEETNGFTRTLQFPRQTETNSGAHVTTTTAEATEELKLAAGWAAASSRRSQGGFHYALRLRGAGNRGVPAGNNGDLFVTVTVQD